MQIFHFALLGRWKLLRDATMASFGRLPSRTLGGIFAPSCDRELTPTAVAPASVGDHHVIAAVRQELHLRHRRVGTAECPNRRL